VTKRVFVSHAGVDSPVALIVAEDLTNRGLGVIIDRKELRGGDSFLTFMEKALSACDYCLLLWSKAASQGKYVQVECEAALYKTIEESRRFLLIARLEDHPLPALLGPRLRVELFPEREPGVTELVALVNEDTATEQATMRPVRLAKRAASEDEQGQCLYVTSELFGRTLPVRWDMSVPVGVHLDRLILDMGLPTQQDIQGVVGVRYNYSLAVDARMLSPTQPLVAQGVSVKSVLWLKVTVQPFAAAAPEQGALSPATFRGDRETNGVANRLLLQAIDEAGLGV
jgi:hypothetical protein